MGAEIVGIAPPLGPSQSHLSTTNALHFSALLQTADQPQPCYLELVYVLKKIQNDGPLASPESREN